MNNKHANKEVWELTLIALCDLYLAIGLSARYALMSAKADYNCGLRLESV